MSLDDNPLARGVCSRLNESLESLPPSITERLSVARCAALAEFGSSSRVKKFSLRSWLNSRVGNTFASTGRWVLPAMFVAGALGFFGYDRYQSLQEQDEFDVDVALLSSDLPIDAYLDRGFSNWLRSGSNQP